MISKIKGEKIQKESQVSGDKNNGFSSILILLRSLSSLLINLNYLPP